ncbi:hypothetical protein AB0M29_40395 [Streptomyces sp. NPDC051976]|uniref:hypothetical protein n=1 Tax=Streptomyces sp. NPDC051976 TaxID=3154947 RepID=UPI003423CF29
MSAEYPPPQTGDQNPVRPFVPPPVAPERNALGRGLVTGTLVAIVAALAYGFLLRALAHDNGHTTELGYGPLAVGALVGITVGKVGGRNTALPFTAALLTAVAVISGDLFGTALIHSHVASTGTLWTAWRHDLDVPRFVALTVAVSAAYGLARRFGDR